MTATSTPTLDMLSNMRDVAALIADDARENLAGVDVISIGPLHAAEPAPGGTRYSVVAIVPDRTGEDCVSNLITLDIAQDPFMATVYRTGLIIALEEFFGRVQIFGDRLTLAKYCQKKWPCERGKQAIEELMRSRGLN
jgi:hypothetical protein